MSINAQIQPNTQTVTEIIGLFKADSYYVDNSFQRRLVWVEKHKVRLIETIMMGYPIPEIYLHQQQPDPETGAVRHSIVDGQQRINCLAQFVANEWPLTASYLDQENQSAQYAGLSWIDFTPEMKSVVWNYTLNIRRIGPDVSIDEVRKVFKRLNETDRSLNPQEIRHAEFNGAFIKVAEEIANHPFWKKHSVFTVNNVRRMADVEFATSLLSLLRNGIITDTEKSVNSLYDIFNEVYEDADKDKSIVNERLKVIDEIISGDVSLESFYSRPVHIFTLFDLLPKLLKLGGGAQLRSALVEFVHRYEGDDVGDVFSRYRDGSIQRTRSKGSRELRRDALLEFLNEKLSS